MVNSPHDALFGYTFAQIEHAAPLLRTVLPAAAAEGLEWSTLRLLEGLRIGPRLQRSHTDLLFSVRSKDRQREVLVHLLVEHSSRVWRWMALRMLAYAVGIWRQWLRQHPRTRRLPRIIPVIVHHSRRAWWAATEFGALLDAGADSAGTGAGAADAVGWRQPQFRYAVLSTAAMAPTEIEALPLSELGTVTLATLQFVPGARPAELAVIYARWGPLMQRLLLTPSGEEAMVALSEYVLTTTPVGKDALIELVAKKVNRTASRIMETTATRLRREGQEEGRLEGRLEERVRLLGRLLTARFGPLPELVARRLTTAEPETAERWALRLLDAESLEDVFADG